MIAFVIVLSLSYLLISNNKKDKLVSKLSNTDISKLDNVPDGIKSAGTVSNGKYNLSNSADLSRLSNDINIVNKQLAALPKPS